jgi:hypothetical protein
MVRPILFEVRNGGTEHHVGYTQAMEGNDWLKDKMERGVRAGMARAGIRFDQDETEWGYENDFRESCHQIKCLWDSTQEEMVEYNATLPSDTKNNARRRMLYHQMAIRMNGNEPLGKGCRVQLPDCLRTLLPSDDGN